MSETWGSPGSGNGQFNFSVNGENAGAIAFAPDGGFWVADTGNFRVQRFDKDRKFLGAWGRFGSADGEFSFPSDISIDALGSVFVADDHRHVIQVFTSDGQYVRSVAAGHAGSFLAATGDGYVDTSLLPDGRPGLTEYKPDGTIQGGIDMPALMPNPLGMTRDDQGDLFIVGLTGSGLREHAGSVRRQRRDQWRLGRRRDRRGSDAGGRRRLCAAARRRDHPEVRDPRAVRRGLDRRETAGRVAAVSSRRDSARCHGGAEDRLDEA